jgi:hypothetical protein
MGGILNCDLHGWQCGKIVCDHIGPLKIKMSSHTLLFDLGGREFGGQDVRVTVCDSCIARLDLPEDEVLKSEFFDRLEEISTTVTCPLCFDEWPEK